MKTQELKIQLENEFNDIVKFIYFDKKIFENWLSFCSKFRKGNQSIEAFSTLISSLNKWRDIVDINSETKRNYDINLIFLGIDFAYKQQEKGNNIQFTKSKILENYR